jgi:hypothetical protein
MHSGPQVVRVGLRASASLRYPALYVGTMAAAVAAGAIIASHNATTTLRGLIGIPIILTWLRYPYFLLLSSVLIDPLVGSRIALFNGNNFDTALTVPTLIVFLTLPIIPTFRRIPALAFFSAFIVWVFLGIGVSPLDHSTFLKQWVLTLDGVAAAVLAVNVVTTPRRMSRLITFLLVAPVGIALYGIYGYITHQNVLVTGTGPARITSILSDAPTLAFLLSNVVPIALYRVVVTRGFSRLIALSVVLILLVATGLTFSRGAIISAVVSLVILIFLLPSARLKLGLVGLGAAVTGIAAVTNLGLFQRFSSSDTATLNGRTYLWHALLLNFDPTQLIGNGMAASDALLTRLHIGDNGQLGNGLIATSPSSLYIGTLYDQGIIGLTLLVLAFVALGTGLIRGMWRSVGEHRVLFVAALLTLVNVLIQSVEQNDFLDQLIGVPFWVIVSLPFAVVWSAHALPGEAMSAVA